MIFFVISVIFVSFAVIVLYTRLVDFFLSSLLFSNGWRQYWKKQFRICENLIVSFSLSFLSTGIIFVLLQWHLSE